MRISKQVFRFRVVIATACTVIGMVILMHSPAWTQHDAEQPCQQHMHRVYNAVLEHLNASSRISLSAIVQAVHQILDISYPPVILSRLGTGRDSAFLVGHSCGIGANHWYGAFTIMQMVNGRYQHVANSEDHFDDKVHHAELDLKRLPNVDTDHVYFASIWTRGGGRPAEYAVVIWHWDGNRLRPIWNRLDLGGYSGANVRVLGPAILYTPPPGNREAETYRDEPPGFELYRVKNRAVSFDGLLSVARLEAYQQAGLLVPQHAQGAYDIGTLWYEAGAINRAIELYDKAIALDASQGATGRFKYLYLRLADLYEDQGDPEAAIQALQRYMNIVQVNDRAKRRIEKRISNLRNPRR